MELAEQAGQHWQRWVQFQRLLYGCAIAIMIVMALMWIFLV